MAWSAGTDGRRDLDATALVADDADASRERADALAAGFDAEDYRAVFGDVD